VTAGTHRVFSSTAAYYDALYHGKDYRAEARYVADVIRRQAPGAESILDVACGTGAHARFLATEHGFLVDGVDREPGFVERARARHPEGTFTQADMLDLALGRTYDAVICLFSSIGYVKAETGLHRAVAAMARHARRDGVLLVEPWFEPGTMQDGFVTCLVADTADGAVCRMSHTAIDGSVSRLTFEYLIGSASGLRRATEVHELGLFTRRQMEEAFVAAGLTVAFDARGPSGRGLYVAHHAR
jgi:SAM-dependent methyltransferase